MELYSATINALQADIACRLCLLQSELDEWQQTTRRGIAEHGIRYLTVVLPGVGKLLDRSLQGDARFVYSGHFPVSLYTRVWGHNGFTLDTHGGTPCTETVSALRQFVYLFYKLELPFELVDEIKTILEFSAVDKDLPEIDFRKDPVLKRARVFTTRYFANFNPREIIPAHGPGSVSTGESQAEKGEFKRIYRTLERYFPFTEYFMYSATHVVDCVDWIRSRETLEHGTAKVVLVPKDSRGPRLISAEPLELQWIQQGLARKLMSFMESRWQTAGFVNFTDQTPNQWLAQLSSKDGNYVTLDMKEASDRVSCSLVESIFSGTSLFDALMACRSAATKLPDGTVMGLKKFAPMGSATCFPVEAYIFYTLALAVLSAHYGCSMEDSVGRVYVYGDDIICKSEDYALLLQYFPTVGLKFNSGKCCTRGFFRESCGVDAFMGVDVTPLKLRTLWSSSKTVKSLLSYVEYSNIFYKRGYYLTAELLRKRVLSKYGKIPYKHRECDAYVGFYRELGWSTIVEYNKTIRYVRYRWNGPSGPFRDGSMTYEIKAMIPFVKNDRSRCSSEWAEMLRRTLRPTGQKQPWLHPVRQRVNLRCRWSVCWS